MVGLSVVGLDSGAGSRVGGLGQSGLGRGGDGSGQNVDAVAADQAGAAAEDCPGIFPV